MIVESLMNINSKHIIQNVYGNVSLAILMGVKYSKFSKYSDTQKICCNLSKI